MASITTKISPAAKRASSKGTDVGAARCAKKTTCSRSSSDVRSTKTLASQGAADGLTPAYKRANGVDTYLKHVHEATPGQMVELERQGVSGTFVTDLSKRMELPRSRVFAMLGISPATAKRKAMVDGQAGLAAIGMIKLLGIAQDIVADSTADDVRNFDTVKWLGQWLERPQAALGGCKPADYLLRVT